MYHKQTLNESVNGVTSYKSDRDWKTITFIPTPLVEKHITKVPVILIKNSYLSKYLFLNETFSFSLYINSENYVKRFNERLSSWVNTPNHSNVQLPSSYTVRVGPVTPKGATGGRSPTTTPTDHSVCTTSLVTEAGVTVSPWGPSPRSVTFYGV